MAVVALLPFISSCRPNKQASRALWTRADAGEVRGSRSQSSILSCDVVKARSDGTALRGGGGKEEKVRKRGKGMGRKTETGREKGRETEETEQGKGDREGKEGKGKEREKGMNMT